EMDINNSHRKWLPADSNPGRQRGPTGPPSLVYVCVCVGRLPDRGKVGGVGRALALSHALPHSLILASSSLRTLAVCRQTTSEIESYSETEEEYPQKSMPPQPKKVSSEHRKRGTTDTNARNAELAH